MSTTEDWDAAVRITNLSAPASAGTVETYLIVGLEPNRSYYAAMRVVANNGSLSEFSNQIRIITADTSHPLSFSAPDIYGVTHSSSEWLGERLVLINFWGAWCYWCRVEIPDLIKVHNEFVDSGLVIIGFNRGDTPEVARDYAEQMQLPWMNILIPGEVVEDYKIRGYPTTVFLDSTGQQLGRLTGLQTFDTFDRVIRYLLNDTGISPANLINVQPEAVK